jgi:hypothetical protein
VEVVVGRHEGEELQRLAARDRAVLRPDDRLVEDLNIALAHSLFHVVEDIAPETVFLAHFLVIFGDKAVLPVCDMAHGIAGAVDGMAGGVFCVAGPVGARSHIQVGLVRVGGPDTDAYLGHALQIILRRGQHREIVPGLTRDRLAREGVGNDLRRSGQQLIAAGIAAAVVEGLKVFQIEGQINRTFPLGQAL